MRNEPAIAVDDLEVAYGEVRAVDGAGFVARGGQVVALLGPNGAGKTTTIETIEGYRRPDRGRVRVLGLDPRADHAALMPRLGVMLQEGGLFPGMKVAEAVHLFGSYYDDPRPGDELIERVGLAGRRTATVRRLSGGEQQRLSLALALVGQPEVLVLDEPTAGLDIEGRRLVRDIVAEQRDRGCCVLVATHDLSEAEKTADRVVIIDSGRVVADGTPRELMTEAGDQIHFGATPGLDVIDLATAVDAVVTEVTPGEYHVAHDPTPAVIARLTAWLAARDIPLADLRAGRQALEDVFTRLTENAEADQDATPERRRGRRRR